MIENPIDFFSTDLISGKKLCLLPIARMYADYPVWLSEKMVFYPPNYLDQSKLHIVWEPDRELKNFNAKESAISAKYIKVEGTELCWMQSAATMVTSEDFLQGGVLAFPMDMDWDSFLSPSSHATHLDFIALAVSYAEKVINHVRFDCCRIDQHETLPERAGLLQNKLFSAALFYNIQDNESYLIAGDVVLQSFTTGLGIDISGAAVPTLPSGEVKNLVSHALQMHTDALEAPNDTAKFINLVNLLEYLADPSEYIPMKKVKGRIARHVAKTISEYEKIIEDFKFLTSKKDLDGSNIGLRHNIIHLGKRLEDILDAEERKAILIRMDRYASMVIEDLLNMSDSNWSDVETLREAYGEKLGIASIP